MGRVTHSWGKRIAESDHGSIISGLPASWIDHVISKEPSYGWMAHGNFTKGPEQKLSSPLRKMIASSGFKRDFLSRLKRSSAFGVSEHLARKGLNRIFTAPGFPQKEKFIYHQPLPQVLPENLPSNCVPVVSIYDIMPFVFTDTYSPASRVAYLKVLESIKKHQAHVIVNSSDTKHSLICFFNVPSDKIHVVPLGADLPEQKNTPGEDYHLPTERPYLLYVAGSSQRRKNIPATIRAYGEFSKKAGIIGDLVIVGVGTESFQDYADHQVSGNGRVYCLGQIDEAFLKYLYSHATIGLYLSLYEGFGLPVLECMQQGLPVICGDKTSLSEVAGDAAILVDPSDIVGTSDAITRLWNDENLIREYSRRGTQRSSEFSWKASTDTLREVYARISK